jgi:importin subunit beta-1
MKTIFDLTAAAFADAHNNEDVAIKALDFWGNVCDQELDQAEEGHSFQFAQAAAPTLVPHLLRMLPSRVATEEELDEDTWDLSRAAGLCLQVLTRAVGDSVLDAVLPFVQQHVTSQDWRAREAAVTAFGAVVDGPAHAKIVPVAQGALASLLAVLKDPSLPVRRSAAYCLGIIFEQLHVPGDPSQPTIVPPEGLAPVLTALLGCITTDDAAVADSAIWTLAQLVQGYADAAHADPDSPSPLTPFFGGLVEALLHAAERPDAVKLRGDAYTTLCDTVDAASAAEAPLLLQLVPHLLAKLAATWENAPAVLSPEGVEAQAELQGHLCGVLMQATTRLSKSGAAAEQLSGLADSMMMAYLRVFACRPNTVHGEAVMAVGALVDALGEKFVKYMPALYPIVELGLKNYAEASVCANAVMLVGDLSRELGSAIMPWADNLMLLLLQDLSSDHISKDVKPHIISAFGDMALAIGPSFDRFLPHVAGMLVSAAQHSNVVAKGLVQSGDDEDTEEARDYNNLLRASILEAYTGILQGLKDDPVKTEQLLKPQAASVAEFIATCFADGTADDGVLVAAVGALGDLASLDGLAPMLANKAELMALLQHCLAMEDGAVKDAALFTQAVIFQR